MKQGKWIGGWRLNVALTAGIMATIMIALVMAQLDALQAQRPDHGRLVIANVQATAVSQGVQINLPYGSVALAVSPADFDPDAPVIPDVNPRTTGTDAGSAPDFPVCGEVPAGWLLYTVEASDTVSLLAVATQSDAAAILAANCLTSDVLTAGMQILLPGQPIAALQCGPPQQWVRYQVRAGDTIGALAVNRGTTVADILRANCRDSEELTAGQMIFLPPTGQAPPVVRPPAATLPAATLVPTAVATLAPPITVTAPPGPPVATPVPTIGPFPPTAVPTLPPLPTRAIPTATPPAGPTVTPPVVSTSPPTRMPPTATLPGPTATLRPTVTSAPPPTNTPPPPPTNTPLPPPTNTPPPPATNTPLPPPTSTPLPPTDTPPPPATETPLPPPTDTPMPPATNTPEPPPPSSPEPPPTNTPEASPAQTGYRPFVWLRYWS